MFVRLQLFLRRGQHVRICVEGLDRVGTRDSSGARHSSGRQQHPTPVRLSREYVRGRNARCDANAEGFAAGKLRHEAIEGEPAAASVSASSVIASMYSGPGKYSSKLPGPLFAPGLKLGGAASQTHARLCRLASPVRRSSSFRYNSSDLQAQDDLTTNCRRRSAQDMDSRARRDAPRRAGVTARLRRLPA